MNREIKFRAWDKKGRFKMVDVLVIDWSANQVFVDDPWNYDQENEISRMADFDEIELMQFTGLHDKNGKEIYEGDVIQGMNKGILLIEFRITAFQCKSNDRNIGFILPHNPHEWATIIGNICENPELLRTNDNGR